MEVLAALMEFIFVADTAWIAVGVPVLLVLGGLTIAGTVLARRAASRGTPDAGGSAHEATALARPARILALAVIALGAVLGMSALTAVVVAAPEGVWMTVFVWVMVAGMVALNALIAALVIVLGVIAREVLGKRRVAGRDTWFAYALVAAAHSGVLVLAAAAGVLGRGIA
jgi:hypothetical protein